MSSFDTEFEMAPNGVKRRKLEHDSDGDDTSQVTSKKAQKAFFKNASNWNLEQDYESRPRKGKKTKERKESSRLPLKTRDGRIEALRELEDEGAESAESDNEWLEGQDNDVEVESEEDGDSEPVEEEKPEQEQNRKKQAKSQHCFPPVPVCGKPASDCQPSISMIERR